MRLLLDEMHNPVVAEQLNKAGHDVLAVADMHVRSFSDNELLAFAETEGRATVTENIGDFRQLAGEWAALGREHAGIIYTLNGRFPRGRATYPRTLIGALRRFLSDPPAVVKSPSWEWWLEPNG